MVWRVQRGKIMEFIISIFEFSVVAMHKMFTVSSFLRLARWFRSRVSFLLKKKRSGILTKAGMALSF